MLNNNDKIRITEGHLSKYASHAKPRRVVLDYAMYLCSFDANLILWINLILSKCVNLNLWRNLCSVTIMKISYPILKFFNSLHVIYNILEENIILLGEY